MCFSGHHTWNRTAGGVTRPWCPIQMKIQCEKRLHDGSAVTQSVWKGFRTEGTECLLQRKTNPILWFLQGKVHPGWWEHRMENQWVLYCLERFFFFSWLLTAQGWNDLPSTHFLWKRCSKTRVWKERCFSACLALSGPSLSKSLA